MASSISPAFTRAVRVASGVASAGVLAGISLAGAAPAMAATDADCTVLNTISASGGGAEADIQLALDDASLPVVCIDGTFVLTTGLTYSRDLTLHGLAGATLDGNNAVLILDDISNTNSITIESLHLTRGSGFNGGAINAGTVTVINSTLDENQAYLGGAIFAFRATLSNSQLVSNGAHDGGAAWSDGVLTVTTSSFSSNVADHIGGAIMSYGTLDVTASTFDDNQAPNGGAVYTEAYTDIANSTFFQNAASSGGAISLNRGTLLQNTFLDNVGIDGVGQAVAIPSFLYNGGIAGEVQLRANLFAASVTTSTQLDDDSTDGFFTDLGGNLFSTSTATETSFGPAPTTRFGVAPAALFVDNSLANNGGPTKTIALKAGSAAINAVTPGSPSVLVDQRGVTRMTLSDAGSFEFDTVAVAPVLPAPAPALAATGVETTGWLGAAAAMLIGGGALALVRTRRLLRRD